MTVYSGSNLAAEDPIEELIEETYDASPAPDRKMVVDPALTVSQLRATNIDDSLGLNDRLEESELLLFDI